MIAFYVPVDKCYKHHSNSKCEFVVHVVNKHLFHPRAVQFSDVHVVQHYEVSLDKQFSLNVVLIRTQHLCNEASLRGQFSVCLQDQHHLHQHLEGEKLWTKI